MKNYKNILICFSFGTQRKCVLFLEIFSSIFVSQCKETTFVLLRCGMQKLHMRFLVCRMDIFVFGISVLSFWNLKDWEELLADFMTFSRIMMIDWILNKCFFFDNLLLFCLSVVLCFHFNLHNYLSYCFSK